MPGIGSARYADAGDAIPATGSEESWSAAPNPGFVRDHAIHFSTKRMLTGLLIGMLVLALGVWWSVHLLMGRSPNGNGNAPWAAPVQRDGGVVSGINALNGGAGAAALPAGTTVGSSGYPRNDALNKTLADCQRATTTTVPVTAATGSGGAMATWGAQANPTIQSLRINSAHLQSAVAANDVNAATSAADGMCSNYPTIETLRPMPDAAGSQAWSAAVHAYATGATEALRSVTGHPEVQEAAIDDLRMGDQQLNTLVARIAGAGHP